MVTVENPCRIVRRADQQGTRPSVFCQTKDEKYATGCDSLSLSTTRSGTRKHSLNNFNTRDTIDNTIGRMQLSRKANDNKYHNIRIASIDVRTLQDDLKLALIVKAAAKLKIDILAMQVVRRTQSVSFTVDDEPLKGWQLAWSGQKRKHETWYTISTPCQG